MSADTIVPNPFHSQDFNRYSYVVNNPLRYTDPTGNEICVEEGSDFGDCSYDPYSHYDYGMPYGYYDGSGGDGGDSGSSMPPMDNTPPPDTTMGDGDIEAPPQDAPPINVFGPPVFASPVFTPRVFKDGQWGKVGWGGGV